MKKQIASMLLALALLCSAFQAAGLRVSAVEGVQDHLYSVEAQASPRILKEGDQVTVKLTAAAADSSITTYNSYDLKLSYDEVLLDFVSGTAADAGGEITPGSGTVRVKGYGPDKSLATSLATLVFRITGEGEAQIRILEAKIDNSENAGFQDAPPAKVPAEPLTVRTGVYYQVTLEGEGLYADTLIAVPEEDFVFQVSDTGKYDYKVRVFVGGKDVTAQLGYDADTGTYTIPGGMITGDILIRAQRTLKPTDPLPTQPTDPAPTEPETTEPEETQPDATEPEETEPEETKPIKPEPGTKPTYVSVTFKGTGAADATGEKKTQRGKEYTFRIGREEGFVYQISAMAVGKTVDFSYDSEADLYRIPGNQVTGNLVITIEKLPVVEVTEFLTLDAQRMFLILYRGSVEEGQTPYYGADSMYYAEHYQAYAWLTVGTEDLNTMCLVAWNQISVAAGQPGNTVAALSPTEVTEAELVQDLYNARYTLDTMEMEVFLAADITGDKKLNIQDVAAAVCAILGR